MDDLGIADTDNASVKNLARLAYGSYDPDAYWNPNTPTAIAWKMRENPEHGQSEPEKGGNETTNKARTGPEPDSEAIPPLTARKRDRAALAQKLTAFLSFCQR